MTDTLTLYCETCKADVEVLAAHTGRAEGTDQYEVLDGLTADDDLHLSPDHDLSTPRNRR